jgi:hypothetical protein
MRTEQDTAQYLLDQVARLTAENAMLKEKWLAPPRALTPRQGLAEYKKGYARAELDLKREPLSDGATADMFHANKKATHADSYWSGVYDAEKAHSIGVDDDNQ